MQARLVSKSPAVLTIRTSVETRAITSEWRAVIDARIFDLKEDPRPSEDGACLEILAERDGRRMREAPMPLHSSDRSDAELEAILARAAGQ